MFAQPPELGNNVGAVLRRAETGEQFTITVSGRPVAQLGPVRARAWVARDDVARAARATRLGRAWTDRSRFPDPLAIDDRVAREWGRLQAAVVTRGGQPRKRVAVLAIAATANVHGAALITSDAKLLAIIADLVDVRPA